MKTILVPIDFSKCSNNAMMYAMEIAQRTGASITALYVVYPNEGIDNNMYDAFFIDGYVQQRLEGMQSWVAKFTRSPHLKEVKIATECEIGMPVSTICARAKKPDISLVVMGTTGGTGLRGILLGSIAAGVLSSSDKPVFVVPEKAVFRNHARFALATDFDMPVSKTSLQVMRELLNLQHTGLNVIYVAGEDGAQVGKKHEAALSERLGTIPHNYHYLHNENVVQAIHNFLESTDCNGLVAVAHKHSLLQKLFSKSITRALAHHSRVPVLVLHDA